MAEPIFDDIEKAPTEPNLFIASNDIEIELNEKFWVELQKNIYQGTYNEDVVEHISKVLKLVDLIYVPGVDSHQLRMKVFHLSLADDAKEWWISRGDGKSPLRRSLLRNYSVDSISNHTMERMKLIFHSWINGNWNKRYVDNNTSRNNEWKESKSQNQSNTAIDSFFKAYDVRNIEKESEQGQTKRKDNNNDDKQPNKRRCKAEKFEAIQYSIRPNEEYIAIRSYEYDIWERNEDNLSTIYDSLESIYT
ncbi:hypothetical protein Tco_1550747 [Tanacetum coccineum]